MRLLDQPLEETNRNHDAQPRATRVMKEPEVFLGIPCVSRESKNVQRRATDAQPYRETAPCGFRAVARRLRVGNPCVSTESVTTRNHAQPDAQLVAGYTWNKRWNPLRIKEI